MKISKIVLALVLSIAITGAVTGTAFAKSYFDEETYPAKVIITGSAVNVRSGPSTSHIKVGLLYKDNIVDCHGKIGSWFLVHLSNDTVGMISGDYSKGYYTTSGSASTPKPPASTPKPAPAATPKPPASTTPAAVTGLTADEQEMFNLVNGERRKNGIAELKANLELTKVARLKSQDLVKNNYFAHDSPTYGTPFEMMKKFGITYKSAGENLAANSSVSAAHTALMNSAGHRANILNPSFTEIGIGIVASPTYGKMFTQMFIGK